MRTNSSHHLEEGTDSDVKRNFNWLARSRIDPWSSSRAGSRSHRRGLDDCQRVAQRSPVFAYRHLLGTWPYDVAVHCGGPRDCAEGPDLGSGRVMDGVCGRLNAHSFRTEGDAQTAARMENSRSPTRARRRLSQSCALASPE